MALPRRSFAKSLENKINVITMGTNKLIRQLHVHTITTDYYSFPARNLVAKGVEYRHIAVSLKISV